MSNPTIEIEINDDIFLSLAKVANDEGVTISHLCERAIYQYVLKLYRADLSEPAAEADLTEAQLHQMENAEPPSETGWQRYYDQFQNGDSTGSYKRGATAATADPPQSASDYIPLSQMNFDDDATSSYNPAIEWTYVKHINNPEPSPEDVTQRLETPSSPPEKAIEVPASFSAEQPTIFNSLEERVLVARSLFHKVDFDSDTRDAQVAQQMYKEVVADLPTELWESAGEFLNRGTAP